MDINDFPNITHPHVKEYFSEAIKSYNSGSFRGCITYTWLSVFMDISQKIEQLARLDAPEAKTICTKLNKIREANNKIEMQKHEREILTIAKEKFNLFDDITLIDLERIHDDRHRCVHPLLHKDGTLYSPIAEQAKTHLLNAYTTLLKEPTVYGKVVIVKLLEKIESSVFPMDYDDCKIVLEESYLKSPNDSLLRNFTIVILKEYFGKYFDKKKQCAYNNVFRYLLETRRGKIEEILKEILPTIIDVLIKKDKLNNLLLLMTVDPAFYNTLSPGNKVFIKNHIKGLPSGNIRLLDKLIDISDIYEVIKERIEKASLTELLDITSDNTSKTTNDIIIKLFLRSDSYEQANSFADVVRSIIPSFDKDETDKLVNGFEMNNQITPPCYKFKSVLRDLKTEKKITEEKYNELWDKYKPQ